MCVCVCVESDVVRERRRNRNGWKRALTGIPPKSAGIHSRVFRNAFFNNFCTFVFVTGNMNGMNVLSLAFQAPQIPGIPSPSFLPYNSPPRLAQG